LKVTEIGSCTAIINSISTTRDGGYKLTLELNPEDRQVINKLMDRYGVNKKVIQIGVIGVEDE
jgi:hypothetical protein